MAEKPPDQVDGPVPSSAIPKMLMDTLVLVPFLVNRTGDGVPATLIEQDCPLANPAQFVFAEPGSTPVIMKSRLG